MLIDVEDESYGILGLMLLLFFLFEVLLLVCFFLLVLSSFFCFCVCFCLFLFLYLFLFCFFCFCLFLLLCFFFFYFIFFFLLLLFIHIFMLILIFILLLLILFLFFFLGENDVENMVRNEWIPIPWKWCRFCAWPNKPFELTQSIAADTKMMSYYIEKDEDIVQSLSSLPSSSPSVSPYLSSSLLLSLSSSPLPMSEVLRKWWRLILLQLPCWEIKYLQQNCPE